VTCRSCWSTPTAPRRRLCAPIAFALAQPLDADGSAIIVGAKAYDYANIPTDRYEPDPDAITLATGDSRAGGSPRPLTRIPGGWT